MEQLRELIMKKVMAYEASNDIDKRDALLECVVEIDAQIQKEYSEMMERYTEYSQALNEEN